MWKAPAFSYRGCQRYLDWFEVAEIEGQICPGDSELADRLRNALGENGGESENQE